MLAYREAAVLGVVKGVFVFAFVICVFVGFGLNSLMGQTKGPAPVFKHALEQIKSKTRIPILLPSRLPPPIRERDIKGASGEVRQNGYFISLFYTDSPVGSDATFAAGFGGSTQVFGDLPNARPVKLAGGLTGMFRPISCGGSCAPANLWWEQDGVMYQIQLKLSSTTTEKDQERLLVETASLTVTVP